MVPVYHTAHIFRNAICVRDSKTKLKHVISRSHVVAPHQRRSRRNHHPSHRNQGADGQRCASAARVPEGVVRAQLKEKERAQRQKHHHFAQQRRQHVPLELACCPCWCSAWPSSRRSGNSGRTMNGTRRDTSGHGTFCCRDRSFLRKTLFEQMPHSCTQHTKGDVSDCGHLWASFWRRSAWTWRTPICLCTCWSPSSSA